MSRRDRPSNWFSTSSTNWARSGGSTAIWCGTRSAWGCECSEVRGGVNWNGAGPRCARWLEYSIIRSMPEPTPTGVAASITNERLPSGAKAKIREVPMSKWKVLQTDRLPAYITWEHYLANQERLLQNRYQPGSVGAPRAGKALLGGHHWFAVPVAGACTRPTAASRPHTTCACESISRDPIAAGLRRRPLMIL